MEYMNKRHILIVDDRPDSIEVLLFFLKKDGYKVTIVENGIDAINFVKENQPDIILLDVMMPEMDGFAVCKHLKEEPLTKEIPVIFITALFETKDIIRGFEVGGVDYITKPFEYKELHARLVTHLNLKIAQEELVIARKMEAIRMFSVGIAHDFNNILSAILGYIELALNDKRTHSEVSDLLKSSKNLAIKAGDLVYKLLTTSHGAKPTLQKFKVFDLINMAVEYSIKNTDIDFEIDVDKDLEILIDFDQMRLALTNIINNSIESMANGGKITINANKIEISSKKSINSNIPVKNQTTPFQSGKYVKITLQDQGIGIAKENLDKLIVPYYSTKKNVSDKGLGLGLTFAYSIINKHDGYIHISSENKKGTLVSIFLIDKDN